MLADMRWQYATMLADIGVVAGPGRGGGGGRGRTWIDDRAAAFNRYAEHPGVAGGAGEHGCCWGDSEARV